MIYSPGMKQGFTLVEIAVVLVVIGLLAGGVLGGRSLIRASELRSVTTQVDLYKNAVLSFKNMYRALPGDMPNATKFFGDRATGTESCADGAISDGNPGTCNGDGDQQIGNTSGTNAVLWEYVWVWQHLGLAGMIDGQYTGISFNLNRGVNVPPARVGQGVFWMVYYQTYQRYANLIYLGSVTGQAWGPVMKANEAYNIDAKIDDGDPFRGDVRTWNGYIGGFPTTGCVSTGSISSATAVTYDFTSTGDTCSMTFFMPF